MSSSSNEDDQFKSSNNGNIDNNKITVSVSVRNQQNLKAVRNKKWRSVDVKMAVGVTLIHFLCIFAPFTFTWPAFWLSFALVWITGLLGITLSYHRHLSHRSFDLPKPLEYLFAYCGAMAVMRDPIYWVSIHRYHHQYTDKEKDPHSPEEGFWFCHMGWLFDSGYTILKHRDRKNVEDLKNQPYYDFLRRTYNAHLFAHAFLLYALGGFPFLVWGMGVRTVIVYHVIFLINSACHMWGKRVWKTNDLSTNNWYVPSLATSIPFLTYNCLVELIKRLYRLVAMVSFGEGWHNNHHAFEKSARHGLEWWQFDPTWYVICILEALGLAWNVKVPSEALKHKKALSAAATTGNY